MDYAQEKRKNPAEKTLFLCIIPILTALDTIYILKVYQVIGTKVHSMFFPLWWRLPPPSEADSDPLNGLQIPNDSNESYNPKSQRWEAGQAVRTLTG